MLAIDQNIKSVSLNDYMPTTNATVVEEQPTEQDVVAHT